MRRPAAILALSCLTVLSVSACGGQSDTTPVACLEGPNVYSQALDAAPGEVELNGETPISDCLAENQQTGDLASVGTAMVTTATKLNSEALADPGGPANFQLGYLLGAAQRGADNTEGIHAELIRRLGAAARYTPEGPPPPAFMSTYKRGYDAGRANG